VFDLQKLIDPDQLDLVIVPLVAFDKSGNRLGKGGGYFDRTFEFLNEAPRPKKPFLCGIAYALQALPSIEPEPWDVKLNAVITEEKIHYFNPP
jgi:5-formyltetrahydrofolate cyclo-ligase